MILPHVLPHVLPPHPRLLARAADWDALRRRVAVEGPSQRLWRSLRQRADAICTEAPLERTMTGRLLLMVSRQALERISVLAIAAQISGEARYCARAIEEMLAVCRFTDWNPAHFLDTAEMCLAVSIGFDWLYETLLPAQREEIAEALVRKALEPSLDATAAENWWLTTNENWAQVCHAGLSAGAIALADHDRHLAEFVLARAQAAMPAVAAGYAPDGAYPEGPMYWSYGTAYQVVLAAAVESLTGSTRGVDAYPGFAQSAQYINAVTAPSGDYFNYADCAPRRRLQAQLFWMSDRYGHPEWLARDIGSLEDDLREYRADPGAQYWYYDMLALALLWCRTGPNQPEAPPAFWTGGGSMPVAVYRWGEFDGFLGIKGGAVGLSHSHMDVGSFIFEAAGVRWAVDPGMQDYAGLEAAGVDLWNERRQDSPRWDVFRIGPEGHNILRVDDRPQLLFRSATLSCDRHECTVDLGDLYGSPLRSAKRRFERQPAGFSLHDEWTAMSPVTMISQWLTYAQPVETGSALVLQQDGRTLHLEAIATGPLTVRIEPFDRPPRSFDAPNPGLKRISLICKDSISGSIHLRARVS